MRVPGLVLVVAIAFFGFGSIASAEKVKTNQEAKLLNHPGEQGAVLLHLKEGQTMTLLSEEGRWLKVRVQGRTGFIPRSKVDMPDNTAIARNTRRRPFVDGRSTHRGFDSSAGPDDRIGADATGDVSSKDTGAGDDDDSAKKPATKKPAAKGDDDDDSSAKKPATKKLAAKGDDDDDDSGKKPAAKKPATKKPAAKGDDDDDDDDSAKKPAAKKPAVKKPTAKSKGDDDDDDDDSGKKAAAAKKPTTVATKAPAKSKGGDDDDDDDSGKKPAAKSKSGDDDDDAKDADSDKRAHAHVDSKEKIYDERNKTSSVAFVAKPGDKLYVDSEKGDWTTVENDDGDAGWILTSDLLVDGNASGGGRKMAIDATARGGVTFIQQGMKTAGSTLTAPNLVPDQYNITASAATISIGGDLYYPVGKKLYIGGELTYDGSKTVGGGIVYMGVDTGFTIHDVNVRAVGAYDFQKPSGMMLLAHLGLRYRAYLVNNYASTTLNPAKIPQERLEAPTIGATLAMPTLGKSYGLAFGLDTILFGSSIVQTAGYEDGATPSLIDVMLSGQFLYRLKPDLNLLAIYRFEYGDYSFGTPPADSMRGHTATGNVSRTDVLNTVTVGIVYGF